MIDTYVISSVYKFYDSYHEPTYYESLIVNYEMQSEGNKSPLTGFIRHDIRFVDLFGNFPLVTIYYTDPTTDYVLNDSLLNDIYVIQNIPTQDTTHFRVKTIYYSDVFGFIRYDMRDGKVYKLQLE